MKKKRSQQEQTVALSRVSAAVKLQHHRSKAHADQKKYDRNRMKRHWAKDQEALSLCAGVAV